MTQESHDAALPPGHRIANAIARGAASSLAQIAFLVLYLVWFVAEWDLNWLMTLLAIVSLTLTQMVLKRQFANERDTRRRDIALHAKLDELIIAKTGARNEIAGIENLDEEEISELRDRAEAQVEEIEQRDPPR